MVVIGYDASHIYVMDPSTLGNYASVPVDEFMSRWHDTDGTKVYRHFGMTFASERKPVYQRDEIKRML